MPQVGAQLIDVLEPLSTRHSRQSWIFTNFAAKKDAFDKQFEALLNKMDSPIQRVMRQYPAYRDKVRAEMKAAVGDGLVANGQIRATLEDEVKNLNAELKLNPDLLNQMKEIGESMTYEAKARAAEMEEYQHSHKRPGSIKAAALATTALPFPVKQCHKHRHRMGAWASFL
mmetsp:Transcript_117188/g.215547  ORF Transcript_117188/g.215547 Transcript_117188/m.215547 type:complete len:171 (+) Transcript_117188:30-542(+)